MAAAFVLPLLAVLVTGEPAATVHIPGSKLSLGMTEDQLRAGDFVATQDGSEIAREGATRFFGVPCRTRLYFRGERLQRAAFEADSVPASDMDDVENQMRHARLWRECVRLEPGNRACDWFGAVRIHVEYQNGRLAAMVTAQSEPAAEDPVPVAANPEPLPASAEQGRDTSEPDTRSTGPEVSLPHSADQHLQGEPAAAAAPAIVAPRHESSEPNPVLPDTLRISLPERNPPTVWPRMDVIAPLEYPQAARAAGVQGIVWVNTLVDMDGTVRTARVDHGGIPALNDAALTWVSRSRFAPCERDGQRYQFWVRVAARFVP
jgi:TonB family protein